MQIKGQLLERCFFLPVLNVLCKTTWSEALESHARSRPGIAQLQVASVWSLKAMVF